MVPANSANANVRYTLLLFLDIQTAREQREGDRSAQRGGHEYLIFREESY